MDPLVFTWIVSMLGAAGMDLIEGGDIWSTGAFSFESPLKDLLDSNDYTLEQLLAEDELLQELRGCHDKLIHYFSTEQAVTKLVQYVILSSTVVSTDNDQNNRHHPAVGLEKTFSDEKVYDLRNGDRELSTSVPTETLEPETWLQQRLDDIRTGNSVQKKDPEEDPIIKHIRFPYMACEVICCEIPGIINTLVEGKCITKDCETKPDFCNSSHPEANDIIPNASAEDQMEVVPKPKRSILDLLFSLPHDTPPGKLDDYRAGYFDKILTVLFRKRPYEMTQYINTGGMYGRSTLIHCILKHLYSHSIMQIAQRLLLPQRPVEQNTQQPQQEQEQQEGVGGDEIIVAAVADDEDENDGTVLCDWSNSPEVLELLLDTLITPTTSGFGNDATITEQQQQQLDLSLNASEVLITIIQNSMLSSSIMLSLTSSASIRRIVDAATLCRGDYFSPRESLLTSAMNVLESLILQLGGYGAVGTMTLLCEDEMQQPQYGGGAEEDENQQLCVRNCSTDSDQMELEKEPDKKLISDLSSLLEHLPRMLDNLSILLRHPSTKSWTSPTQFSMVEPQQLLGNSRLRIVRVIESLVLLGDPEVDYKLIQSNCLEICLDFFWEFQWCSMLHQSVANLLVHVFEGQNARIDMQEYFLVKCNLLRRLMDSFDVEVHIASGGSVSGVSHVSHRDENKIIPEVVESIPSVAADTVSLSIKEDENVISLGNAPLSVSEDDIDAAMETGITSDNAATQSLVSTEAIKFVSIENLTVSDGQAHSPAQSFRCGYMGHVIIICQALVHAYSNDQGELTDDGVGMSENQGREVDEATGQQQPSTKEILSQESEGDEMEAYEGPKDDFGEPLLLAEVMTSHKLAERWQDFVDTTLAAETAIQSTPLGGYSMNMPTMDSVFQQRPGLADEGYMMGDDGEGPPAPPRGMLGGGEAIDMDDNDLDIAANMMASLSLGSPNTMRVEVEGDNDSVNSGDSNRSYNSGETASEHNSYAFDDPLGKAGGLGIELGKLAHYNVDSDGADQPSIPGSRNKKDSDGDDNDNNSYHSSDEEPESDTGNNDDVPVMDLFAGNFDHDGIKDYPPQPPLRPVEFADFAVFETAVEDSNPTIVVSESLKEEGKDEDSAPFARNVADADTLNLDEIFGKGDHSDLLEQNLDAIQPQVMERSFNTDDDFPVVEKVNPLDLLSSVVSLADGSGGDEVAAAPIIFNDANIVEGGEELALKLE